MLKQYRVKFYVGEDIGRSMYVPFGPEYPYETMDGPDVVARRFVYDCMNCNIIPKLDGTSTYLVWVNDEVYKVCISSHSDAWIMPSIKSV